MPKYLAIAHEILAKIAITRDDIRSAEAELAAAIEILKDYPAPLVKVRDGALIGPHRVTISLEETNPARCKRVTKLVKDVKVGDNDIELDLTPEAGGR